MPMIVINYKVESQSESESQSYSSLNCLKKAVSMVVKLYPLSNLIDEARMRVPEQLKRRLMFFPVAGKMMC